MGTRDRYRLTVSCVLIVEEGSYCPSKVTLTDSEVDILQSRNIALRGALRGAHTVRGEGIENREDFVSIVTLTQHGDHHLLRHNVFGSLLVSVLNVGAFNVITRTGQFRQYAYLRRRESHRSR